MGDALARLKDKLTAQGGSIETVIGDVRQDETHARLVARALDRFGRLDLAFNNAATVGRSAPLTEHDNALNQQINNSELAPEKNINSQNELIEEDDG